MLRIRNSSDGKPLSVSHIKFAEAMLRLFELSLLSTLLINETE